MLRILLIGLALSLADAAEAILPRALPDAVGLEQTVFASTYRGDPAIALARTPWGTLTERELFLHLLLSGADDPLLVEKYRKAQGDEIAERQAQVEAAIQDWALTSWMALMARESGAENLLNGLRLRLAVAPAEEILWIDQYIAPAIRVLPEDVRKYYDEHPEEVPAPSRAAVRYIFLRVDSDEVPPSASGNGPGASSGNGATLGPEWEVALAKMEAIYDDLMTNRVTFEDAARRYSQAPSAAKGGLVEFEQGSFFPEFEKIAFDAAIGLPIREFIRGPKGLYLLEVVSRETGRHQTLEEAEPMLRRRLYFEQLRHRYDYELALLEKEKPIFNHAANVDGMESDAPILEAGSLHIDANEAWEIFPFYRSRPERLKGRLDRIGRLDLIEQFNHDQGWRDLPMQQLATRVARNLMLAQIQAQRYVDPRLRLTREQIHRYILARPGLFPLPHLAIPGTPEQAPAMDLLREGPGEAFDRLVGPRFSLVQVRVLDSPALGETGRASEMARMEQALADARDACASRTLAQIAAEWPVREVNPADLVPMRIESDLRRQADPDVEIVRWRSSQSSRGLPPATNDDIGKVRATLPEWIEGEFRFSPIRKTSDSLTLYYVEQPDYSEPAIANLLRLSFYRIVAEAIQIETLEAIRMRYLSEEYVKILLPGERMENAEAAETETGSAATIQQTEPAAKVSRNLPGLWRSFRKGLGKYF